MGKCEVEVFSRVTGFFRPVQAWNPGKIEEFGDRKKYTTSTQLENESIDKVVNKENK
jgi:hypothetical protein